MLIAVAKRLSACAALLAAVLLSACGGDSADVLTVYSGRSETLVGPILDRFADDTGIDVRVRYGDTAELAATILEEGGNSPADVFFAQDAGALGALASEQRLQPLPQDILDRVEPRFRSRAGLWVGVSGRARVVAYNTARVPAAELPESIFDLTASRWDGRVGWVPTNGSFQAFVTALRLTQGDGAARSWLEAMQANDPRDYANNAAAVQAVAAGEVDVALVNHYYLYRFLAEQGDGFQARNHYLRPGDPGALVNVAGAGVLDTAGDSRIAQRFIEFLLASEAQQFFAEETFEYPLIAGVQTHPGLAPLGDTQGPDVDLGDLADLEGTLELLQDTGVLP